MSEPNKQQIGDGSDNYGQAAKQMANVAKQTGKNAAVAAGKNTAEAAAKGAEATARAAAATVKAGVKTGKAVAGIATGTAAGGPWGAAIAAAWSMRHTLFKILITIGLVVLFIIIIVVSLPKIIFESIFGTDDPSQPAINAAYIDLETTVTGAIAKGYEFSMKEVDRIIDDGGYDYDASMAALIDNAKDSKDYDVCYILAAYSVSMEQQNTTKANMVSKLNAVSKRMFPVTYVVKTQEREEEDGEEKEEIRYVECTVHSFDNTVINAAFGIDPEARYDAYDMTNGQAIEYMANFLKMTLFGSLDPDSASKNLIETGD